MTLKLKRAAAILEGGPRHGWAYYVDDLEAMIENERRCGRDFGYRRTERRMIHPRAGGKVDSEVWEWVEPRGFAQPPPMRRERHPVDDMPDPWAGFG